MKYLCKKNILDSYTSLSKIKIKNESIFHIFLILKGCGFNNVTFKNLTLINDNGFEIAYGLSSLFSPLEETPDKYNFINPFKMADWTAQAPSENLKKWVNSRVKNNIIGGATTWRKIIKEDLYEGKIKFSNNYIDEILDLVFENEKIDLKALAIWYYRFSVFESNVGISQIIKKFIEEFNLEDIEVSSFFNKNSNIDISFEDDMIDMSLVRKIIGNPQNYSNQWEIQNLVSENNEIFSYSINKRFTKEFKSMINKDDIKRILLKNKQIILSGSPGTSKSYIADEVAKSILTEDSDHSEKIVKIQFHPQFTYQDFIGGFIVKGEQVEVNKGILLDIIDKANSDTNNNYILIIDEINRGNVSSIFGEVIQLLDRGYETTLKFGGDNIKLILPQNLYIIATMNSSDRSLSNIDFAIRRRFSIINMAPNELELIDKIKNEENIDVSEFLVKINSRLINTLKSNQLVIGQAIFYQNELFDNLENKFIISNQDLQDIIKFKVFSIIEDYCNYDQSKILDIIPEKLYTSNNLEDFIDSLKSFINGDN
ncbi:AAA family ATPase [Empedobacter falsenii]